MVAKHLATAGFGAHANAGVSPSASTAITLAPNCNRRRVIWTKEYFPFLIPEDIIYYICIVKHNLSLPSRDHFSLPDAAAFFAAC